MVSISNRVLKARSSKPPTAPISKMCISNRVLKAVSSDRYCRNASAIASLIEY